MACDAMVRRKERLIEAAITKFYGGTSWSEDFLAEHCIIEIDQNAIETLIIDGFPMLEFHPVRSDIVLDGEAVKIQMTQPYRVIHD